MNNDDSPATNPGGIDRAPTVKRVSSRDESRIYKGSNDDYSMRSKLSDTFGQLLDEEAIKAIADVVHGDNQKCCSLCKSSSEGLVMNVIQILCQFMIKKYELPVCKENFTTKATTPSCDGSPTLNLGIKYPGTDTMKALTPKSQGIVTPAVKEVSPNPVISGNSKPVPAHVMKKRIHSKIDNGRALSIANLFPPDNIPADSVVRVNKLGLPAGIHAEECSPTNNASEVCVIKDFVVKESAFCPNFSDKKDLNLGKSDDLSSQLKPLKNVAGMALSNLIKQWSMKINSPLKSIMGSSAPLLSTPLLL